MRRAAAALPLTGAAAFFPAAAAAQYPDRPLRLVVPQAPGSATDTVARILAPADLPPGVLAKLNAAVNEAIRSPIFMDRFALIGDEPAGGTPADFADTIRRDSARWAEVIRRSGARID